MIECLVRTTLVNEQGVVYWNHIRDSIIYYLPI